MTGTQLIEKLGEWEGYRLVKTELLKEQGREWVRVELTPRRKWGLCNACGSRCERVHDMTQRTVMDLPILGKTCLVVLPRRRFVCPVCRKARLERLSWLAPWSRFTNRLCASVALLCQVMSVKHAAQHYAMDWKSAKGIDKRALEKQLGAPDLKGLRVVAMDEFAIRKGQRYATIFVEPMRKQVLWVCKGNSKEAIRPFFEMLGEEGRHNLEAVVMDMNGAFESEVRAQCPNVRIVYDHYHVIAKYSHEVINRVRLEEMERLRKDKPGREVVRASRWLLLRNPSNVRGNERIRLNELLAANRRLALVHILREDLSQLWRYKSQAAAIRFWKQWRRRAMRSRMKPLKRFIRRLDPYVDGIIAHCKYPFHTSLLEGINNKIKVIKRTAYGFRDYDYFFLKIRQAFPAFGR